MMKKRNRVKITFVGYRVKNGALMSKPFGLTEEKFQRDLRNDGFKGRLKPQYFRGG